MSSVTMTSRREEKMRNRGASNGEKMRRRRARGKRMNQRRRGCSAPSPRRMRPILVNRPVKNSRMVAKE